jgi:hypothetical protein
MSDAREWRYKFIELVEGVFREIQFDPPVLPQTIDEPVELALDRDGVDFAVIHRVDHAHAPERIKIECQFGLIPEDDAIAVLTHLMETNLTRVREYEPVFSVDTERNCVIYSFSFPFEGIEVPALLDMLDNVAEQAHAWRQQLSGSPENDVKDPGNDVVYNGDYRQQFIALFNDICSQLGYATTDDDPDFDKQDVDELSMSIEVNDVNFMVTHVSSNNPEKILVECRVGPLPLERGQPTLTRLLELNNELADDGEQAYGIDAETGEVVHTRVTDIANESSVLLLNAMAFMAHEAEEWNETFYLDDNEIEPVPTTTAFSYANFA